MKKWILLLCLFQGVLLLTVQAQEPQLKKEKWHWGREQDTAAGYAQVVKVGNILYISGTISREVSPEGITNLYSNLEKSLKHYGATFQHL